MLIGSVTFSPRHPMCQCPTGGYWSVIPPYCPVHNPRQPVFTPPPVITTTTTVVIERTNPAGNALRPEDV